MAIRSEELAVRVGSEQRAPGRLLVIVPDRLTELVAKGEVTERYYNPGELFDEVHLLLLNDDAPDPAAVQPMVGRARLVLHNLAPFRRMFVMSLGWQPWLIRGWAERAVALAHAIRPQLIRCHGHGLPGFLGSRIKRALSVPYVVSLHTDPTQLLGKPLKARLQAHALRSASRIGLREADRVLPVYRSLVPYLERIGARRIEVAYNVLNPTALRSKPDYRLHDPVEIVSVGREIPGKNPEHLIEAVAALAGVRLTLIGDGPLHEHLRRIAQETGAGGRISFIPSMPNDELCRRLADYDLFAVHNDYRGIPKTLLEAWLTGLPVIANRAHGHVPPELDEAICLLVENSEKGYRAGIERLLADPTLRERLGRTARARQAWAPEIAERRYVDIYRAVMEQAE